MPPKRHGVVGTAEWLARQQAQAETRNLTVPTPPQRDQDRDVPWDGAGFDPLEPAPQDLAAIGAVQRHRVEALTGRTREQLYALRDYLNKQPGVRVDFWDVVATSILICMSPTFEQLAVIMHSSFGVEKARSTWHAHVERVAKACSDHPAKGNPPARNRPQSGVGRHRRVATAEHATKTTAYLTTAPHHTLTPDPLSETLDPRNRRRRTILAAFCPENHCRGLRHSPTSQ